MIGVNESFRLLNVDLEVAFTVEKGVFAVDLDDAKVICSADGEERAYRVNSDDRCERFIEIQFSLLRKSFDNNATFVFLENICCIVFLVADPSQWQGASSRR